MGRDVLEQLGITLKQQQRKSPDQETLRHPALPREIMWDWDQDSEPELNIQYKAQSQPLPANSDTDDSENAPLLSHTRVPEEKAEKAKQLQARAVQSRSDPLQQSGPPQPSNIINTQTMGHDEVVAMARKNQRAQKRPRTTTSQQAKQGPKPQKRQATKKSPGSQQRPQWLKKRQSETHKTVRIRNEIEGSCTASNQRKKHAT